MVLENINFFFHLVFVLLDNHFYLYFLVKSMICYRVGEYINALIN